MVCHLFKLCINKISRSAVIKNSIEHEKVEHFLDVVYTCNSSPYLVSSSIPIPFVACCDKQEMVLGLRLDKLRLSADKTNSRNLTLMKLLF